MATLRAHSFVIGSSAVVACTHAVACGENAADSLGRRRGTGSSNDPSNPSAPNKPPPEEAKFRALEPDLLKACGKGCHDTGTDTPTPPAFLAGPDVYESIKAQPGIVVRDVYTSVLLTKGPHAGPAISQDAELENKVIEWLEAEAIVIQSQELPTTPPFTVTSGPNDVDLAPAAVDGLRGVHLKFEASLVDTILSLSNITIVPPVGPDVHVLRPRFVRVLPTSREDGSTDVVDPADSFSNSDQTIPNGEETPLSPGSVLFSGEGWHPFDLAADKIRIEMTKLEPGKISVMQAAATCKDVDGFANTVLPTLRNQQTSAGNNCQGCHGEGLGGMNLANQDNALICQQLLPKLNQTDLGQSLLVTKVTGGMAHNGGTVPNANAWRSLFVKNASVFF